MPYEHLSDGERRVIEKMNQGGYSQAEIARFLKRSDSTISRELRRNDRINYSSFLAQKRYLRERKKCKYTKFSNEKLLKYVLKKISLYWSCEQISGRLEIDFPDEPAMQVSFETIYEYIFRYYPKMFQYFRVKGKYKKVFRGWKNKRKLVIWGTRREISERCEAASHRKRVWPLGIRYSRG